MKKVIELKAMRVNAEIGIHDFEQGTQPYDITVRLTLANSYFVMTDRIEDAVNYDRLRDEIAQLFNGGRINLQETVIQKIMGIAFGIDMRVKAVEASVSKPTVYPDCEGVGLIYEATREEWYSHNPVGHYRG